MLLDQLVSTLVVLVIGVALWLLVGQFMRAPWLLIARVALSVILLFMLLNIAMGGGGLSLRYPTCR